MIAVAVVAFYCLYFLVIGVAYLISLIVVALQLMTGKLTREQIAENAATYNEQKRQEKERKRFIKWLQDVTRPSVIDVVLGRSSRRRNVFIHFNTGDSN